MGTVDLEEDLAVNADGARVLKIGKKILKMGFPLFLCGGVGLLEKDLLIVALPAAGPAFVGPGQAEGNVNVLVMEDQLLGSFQKLHIVVKPVVVNGPAADAVLLCQFRLPANHIHIGKVIVIVI